MNSDDRPDGPLGDDATVDGLWLRNRLVTIMAAVLAGIAVVVWGVPTLAAIAGVVLLIGAAALGRTIGQGPLHRRVGGGVRNEGRRGRTDTGIRAAVEAIDEPVVVVDTKGTVRWANREAIARMPSLKPGDPMALGVRVTVLRDTVDEVIALGRAATIEWQERVPTDRWLRAHVAPMWLPPTSDPDRPPDLVLVRIEDLTEQRRVERMRADFVANASHELRTPLAAVTGFIETLQGPARDDAKARERFLAIMAEQAGRMRRLIDDLLSLSRVEMRTHLRPTARVELTEVIHHVLDLVAPSATGAGVTIAVEGADTTAPVRGDREELIQVFVNLIENAIKYGGSGGRVVVAIARDGRHTTIEVRDFGPGIASVHLPRLTERFYRAHDEGGAKRGTGLGLAIVKHIITRHGGRLEIASRVGEGSTFTVVLDREDS